MLLNLMAASELKEAIKYLESKLMESKVSKGDYDKRTVEISHRLKLYTKRYMKMTGNEP